MTNQTFIKYIMPRIKCENRAIRYHLEKVLSNLPPQTPYGDVNHLNIISDYVSDRVEKGEEDELFTFENLCVIDNVLSLAEVDESGVFTVTCHFESGDELSYQFTVGDFFNDRLHYGTIKSTSKGTLKDDNEILNAILLSIKNFQNDFVGNVDATSQAIAGGFDTYITSGTEMNVNNQKTTFATSVSFKE